jgi:hypothetical protein
MGQKKVENIILKKVIGFFLKIDFFCALWSHPVRSNLESAYIKDSLKLKKNQDFEQTIKL